MHGVNAFALPVTLMVTVEIKHHAPDSAAEKAGSFKERVRAGLLPARPSTSLVSLSAQEEPLPGKERKATVLPS